MRSEKLLQFDELIMSGLFSDEQLKQIMNVRNEVMDSNKAERVFTESSKFEIDIFPSGCMLVVLKSSGEIITRGEHELVH
jgi:hypothetical protein